MGIQQSLLTALISISLTATDVERIFMCLFVTCASSVAKCTSFCTFLNRITCVFVELREFFKYSGYKSFVSNMWTANIFSYSMACFFIVLTEDSHWHRRV